jgi:hypothetical protein
MSLETASSVGLQLDKDGRKSLVSIAQHAPIPVDTCLNAPEDLQDTLVHTTSYADGNFLILSLVISIMEISRGGLRIFLSLGRHAQPTSSRSMDIPFIGEKMITLKHHITYTLHAKAQNLESVGLPASAPFLIRSLFSVSLVHEAHLHETTKSEVLVTTTQCLHGATVGTCQPR